MSAGRWGVEFAADGTIRASGAAACLRIRSAGPRWEEGEEGEPSFGQPTAPIGHDVAGETGTVWLQHARSATAALTREMFLSRDGRTLALRLKIGNRADTPRRLGSLTPLAIVEADGLRLAGTDAGEWHVTRMSRHKNDIPGCFHPLHRDIHWQQALVDGAEFRAGMGGTAAERAAADRDPDSVPADPGFCIRAASRPGAPVLLAAVLGQTEHLNRVVLAVDAARAGFRSLRAVCEFDGVVVPPGAARETHWVVLREDADEHALWQWHAGQLARALDVPRPGPPPTIFCRWYFYGRDFTEDDLRENLAELRRRPTPFDVLLIDNGWMDRFGDWNAHPARFPSGMRAAAAAIRDAGRLPGIWTCPFVLSPRSTVVARQPRLVLRDRDGVPCTFPYREPEFSEDLFVLDPTAPEAADYLRDIFQRLARDGYRVHKLDFLRAVVVPPHPRFHDAAATRAQAYRRGMEAIRRAVGPDGYLLACGGLFEGSAGLVNGNRVGSDVKGRWTEPDGRPGHLVRIQQNVYRSHTNRLWHTDPDALQLRRRAVPFRGRTAFAHLSDGKFTDDEAVTCVANHYIGGGLVCFAERLAEFDEDRRLLLRHVIPPVTPPAVPLDIGTPGIPAVFRTRVTPRAPDLAPWWTIAVFNWEDTPAERQVALDVPAATPRLAVFELVCQRWCGTHPPGASIALRIPAHGVRVLRIAEWEGRSPILLGTDGQFTGGAAEIAAIVCGRDGARGKIVTPWPVPVALTFGCAGGVAPRLVRVTLRQPGIFRCSW